MAQPVNDREALPASSAQEPDWEQAALCAEFQGVLGRLHGWAGALPAWPPYQFAQQLVAAVAPRLREMQVNLGRMLVVGVVGGTGVGKSTLINALVGRSVCATGHRRPTTCRPMVLCHQDSDPSFLHLDGEEFELHKLAVPLLEEMVLIDCPDPDTEGPDSTENRNLEILRRVLPHCDVVLYVGTEQKYKTEAVQREVLRHAAGRTVLFVQNQAARDHDVREDWKTQLESLGFKVPPIFFLDSELALARQRQNAAEPEEFQRLRQHLRCDIAHRARHRIKRVNALDLLTHLLGRIVLEIEGHAGTLLRLKDEVRKRRQAVFAKIQGHVRSQLDNHRALWHVRLAKQLIHSWGSGLFVGLFRLMTGIGSLFNLLLLSRVRTPVQLLVASGIQAGRKVGELLRQEKERGLWITAADFGVSDGDLLEARSVLQGFARDAGLDARQNAPARKSQEGPQSEQLRTMARQLYQEVEAALEIAVERQVAQKAGTFTRLVVEFLFLAPIGYALFLLGRNFFYEAPWLEKPLLGVDFLMHAVFWVVVWGVVLQWALMRRLRRGLDREIAALVNDLPAARIVNALFSDLEKAADDIEQPLQALKAIEADVRELKTRFGQIEDVEIGRLDRPASAVNVTADPVSAGR
jgi:energy-coupling factor transporter ATP-binding protein EcfA2